MNAQTKYGMSNDTQFCLRQEHESTGVVSCDVTVFGLERRQGDAGKRRMRM
jgi:hypothetical protein